MRVEIVEDPAFTETVVRIGCARLDQQVTDLVARLRILDRTVVGVEDGTTYVAPASEVRFVESVDRRCFAYTADRVLESRLTLAEFEDRLGDVGFVRASRSCIVNLSHVAALRPDINGRLRAVLDTAEELQVSRSFVRPLKRALGME